MIEKPLVTVSGKKILFTSNLHERLAQDLPREDVEWRRRLDSKSKQVYIDVDFVDFDVDNVERSSEKLSRLAIVSAQETGNTCDNDNHPLDTHPVYENSETRIDLDDEKIEEHRTSPDSKQTSLPQTQITTQQKTDHDSVSKAFFNQKLLGRPILHTYWADKTDFEDDNQKSQFDEWIGQVQASTCTEWAIIIIEDGDLKAHIGTALFKSKLQSSASQASQPSSSIGTASQASILNRMKKGLSTIFQSDSNSDRWLTLVNQDRLPDNKAQESYNNFVKKFRNIMMASFSKQIELFEEQLRVRREMRTDKNWEFYSYFLMQEDLAFAFEFLTLFDEALLQYEILEALFTEHIFSPGFNAIDEPLYKRWTSFEIWTGLCLDINCAYSKDLRQRIIGRRGSLLDMRCYLFAKRCDLMLLQNQPWKVAASASVFLHNTVREHQLLDIITPPGALASWCFVSALEVLQKCECYSCTSTMENYSFHTVDIWNCARVKLLELGHLTHQMPGLIIEDPHKDMISQILVGAGPDPHNGLSYQKNDISPYARLKDALGCRDQFCKHLIEISELTLGTYKHIGRKRHALLVGREMADFYMAQSKENKALPFLVETKRYLGSEPWPDLITDVQRHIERCNQIIGCQMSEA